MTSDVIIAHLAGETASKANHPRFGSDVMNTAGAAGNAVPEEMFTTLPDLPLRIVRNTARQQKNKPFRFTDIDAIFHSAGSMELMLHGFRDGGKDAALLTKDVDAAKLLQDRPRPSVR